MSDKQIDGEPEDLLRRLATETVVVSPEDGSPARRDRLVRAMKDAIERTSEQVETRRRWRRLAYGLAAAAALILASGLLLQRHWHRPQAVTIAGIDRVSGTVVLMQNGAGQVMGTNLQSLNDGDAVQTAAGAHARLTTSKSAVSIGESTELKLSRPTAAEERISLRRGRVEVAVNKAIEAGRAVVVETPDAEVVVRGTTFAVRVEPNGSGTTTYVHVSHGSVWVLAHGVQVALLSAGQEWSSANGLTAPAASALAVSASPQVPSAPAATALAPTAPAPDVSVVPTPTSQKATKVSAKPVAARKPGTLTDENRLFAAGVDARNRGDSARAADLFGELLGSYPNSALREAAQVERFRALSRAGQKARAASEARRYLAEHGDGFAKSEARDLALDAKP